MREGQKPKGKDLILLTFLQENLEEVSFLRLARVACALLMAYETRCRASQLNTPVPAVLFLEAGAKVLLDNFLGKFRREQQQVAKLPLLSPLVRALT